MHITRDRSASDPEMEGATIGFEILFFCCSLLPQSKRACPPQMISLFSVQGEEYRIIVRRAPTDRQTDRHAARPPVRPAENAPWSARGDAEEGGP